jgi:hypothetical protein
MTHKHKTGYMSVGGGYEYAALRNGLSVRHPDGREVYVQPGDDETEMRLVLSALDEISCDADDPKRARIADISLGSYFI